MSALFTESGCPLELLLPTTTSTCKCKKTYITRLLRELNVLKVGQNRDNFIIFAFFEIFNKLYNYVLRATFLNSKPQNEPWQNEPLAINTEL